MPDGAPTPAVDADERAFARVREALRSADFTVDEIGAVLGTTELSSRRTDVAVHARRLADDAFSVLARLFLLGFAVPAAAVDAVVATADLEALRVAACDADIVRPQVRLVPHGDYLIASDFHPEEGGTPFDFVPGIQAPSVTLAKLAVRRPIARALDLGTGCGIQALLAAKHSERVVATDVNPRALAFAAFNARLNGLDNVAVRLGGGFDPVADDRFDLIVSNPPYVISPDRDYAYRDSGLAGDELCRGLVAAAPDHLADGGFAHLLVSWSAATGDESAEPLRPWVEGSGCDSWLLHYRTEDPLTHAAGWLRPGAETDPAGFAPALDRWVGALERLGVEAVGYGAVVLRRRAGGGSGWVATERLPLERLEPAGEHTLRVFAGRDLLATTTTLADLLDERLALVEQHRLSQVLAARGGGFTVESQTLELTDGLRLQIGVDRHTASLLPHLDGERPLREALAAAATTFDLGALERARFAPAALPVVARLLELGFLVRA
jgi:methylase of polypeptide subunit release factors